MREVAAVHTWTWSNLALAPTFRQHWVVGLPPSIWASRGWHSSSSFSQCRWFLLPNTWWFTSSRHSGSVRGGVTSHGQCASPIHGAGMAAAEMVQELSRRGLTQEEECELCSPSDSEWHRCWCTGGGKAGTIWSAVCQEKSLQRRWSSSPPVPRWGNWCQGCHAAIHTMRIMGEEKQETSWQEEIRGKGCEEQLVHPQQAERVSWGWNAGCRMDKLGLHPQPCQPLPRGPLLQPPAMVWVENSLLHHDVAIKAVVQEMERRARKRHHGGTWRSPGKLLVREMPPAAAGGAGGQRDPVATAGFIGCWFWRRLLGAARWKADTSTQTPRGEASAAPGGARSVR